MGRREEGAREKERNENRMYLMIMLPDEPGAVEAEWVKKGNCESSSIQFFIIFPNDICRGQLGKREPYCE